MVLLAALVLLALYALHITGLGSKLVGWAEESLRPATKMTCTLPHNLETVTGYGKNDYFASRYSSASAEGKTEDGKSVTCSSLSGVRVGNHEAVKYSGADVQYCYNRDQYTETVVTYRCFGGDCNLLMPKTESFENSRPVLTQYLVCSPDSTYKMYFRNLTVLQSSGEYSSEDYLKVPLEEETGSGCPREPKC